MIRRRSLIDKTGCANFTGPRRPILPRKETTMKTTKPENLKNQPTGSPAEALTDLPVSTGQAEQTQGGATPKLFLHACSGVHI
jgi:hypothetical protein